MHSPPPRASGSRDAQGPDDPRVTHWDGPGLDAWDAWTPAEIAQRLAGITIPWCVVGGWAIDVFLGAQTRDHEDLEVAVLREHFSDVRRVLGTFVFHVVGDGEVRRLPDAVDPPPEKHQNWVLDVTADAWRVDVMLEPGDAATWVFRRDEAVRAPRDFMVQHTADGIPALCPHGVLLYKAKATRPKDEADLAACLPRMTSDQRVWLANALERVHPGHPWRESVTP